MLRRIYCHYDGKEIHGPPYVRGDCIYHTAGCADSDEMSNMLDRKLRPEHQPDKESYCRETARSGRSPQRR